ncbi:MAG: hypothetical protein O3A00_10925 [Planctomycetota bacterium]|nr:hypothetical protein [Planctomycetota bacterium]
MGSQWKHLTHSNSLGATGGGTASNSAPHADSREMVFDANGNIIEVDDGGVYRRTSPTDNTGDWFSVIGNLQVTEAHDVAYDTNANRIVTGNQDTGTTYQSSTGGFAYTSLSTADGGDVAVDNVSLAGSNQSVVYSSFQNLGNFTKRTFNATGTIVGTVFPALTVDSGAAIVPKFVTPVIVNMTDPNDLLFVTDNGLYESGNQGENVAQVLASTNLTSVSASYGSGGSAETIVVGAASGDVLFRQTVAGGFTTTNTGGGSILDVLGDPSDFTQAFAIDTNQVFRTANTGSNWSDITGDLTSTFGVNSFFALEYIEGTAGTDALLVGTERGMYYSLTSALGTWALVGANLPNVLVYDIVYDVVDDLLVAGTLGRGACTFADASDELFAVLNETSVALSGNDLVITDVNGGTSNDNLTISTNGTIVTMTDPSNLLTVSGITGATGNGTNTVTVPLSSFTGGIVVNTLGGNDTLTVDLSLGNFSRAISYAGGTQTTGDSLALTGGGTFASLQVDHTDLDTGIINITGNSPISYDELEPIRSTITAQSVTLNFSTASETITVTSGGVGKTTVGSTAGESVTFNNPTTGLFINGGNTGNDTINVQGVGSGFAAAVTINGGTGTDSVTFQTTATDIGAGSLGVTAETITVSAALAASSVGLTATGAIGLNANITTGSFNANTSGGALTMSDGAVVDVGGGTIDIDANATVTLGRLVTTNNTATAIDVLTAGSILDAGDSTGLANISAVSGTVTLTAPFIGTANSIETATGTMVINTRDANLTNTGNLSLDQNDNSGIGFVTVNNTGTLTLENGWDVTGAALTSTGAITFNNAWQARNQVSTITSSGGDISVSAAATVTTFGQNITFTANDISIDATAAIDTTPNAVDANAFFVPNSGRTIDIGATGGGGQFVLTDAELDRVTTGNGRIEIGNVNSGNVVFTSAVDMANSSTLKVVTGGTINDTGTTDVFSDTNLALSAALGIGTSTAFNTATSNPSATVAAGGINLRNTGDIDLENLVGINGVTSTGSNVNIVAASTINVNAPVTATARERSRSMRPRMSSWMRRSRRRVGPSIFSPTTTSRRTRRPTARSRRRAVRSS